MIFDGCKLLAVFNKRFCLSFPAPLVLTGWPVSRTWTWKGKRPSEIAQRAAWALSTGCREPLSVAIRAGGEEASGDSSPGAPSTPCTWHRPGSRRGAAHWGQEAPKRCRLQWKVQNSLCSPEAKGGGQAKLHPKQWLGGRRRVHGERNPTGWGKEGSLAARTSP